MLKVREKLLQNYRFIDLFAGIGGFRIALESLGGTCVYSSEWDKQARQTYVTNFGEMPDGDITKIDEASIPDHDILCAGFPCQAFSISGKQEGFNDTRGTLFFDIARIAKEKKPKVLFLENVKNFASHDKGNTLKIVYNTLVELGYDVYYKVLNARDYGIPQNRERIYIVGFRSDLKISHFEFPKKVNPSLVLSDLLINDYTDNLKTNRSDITFKNSFSEDRINKPNQIGYVNKGGQGERIYHPNGIAITLSAYGGGAFAKTGGYLINGKVRKLHPRECARVMGFPDDYIISQIPNVAYRQFGNSVVIDVIQKIGIQIGEAINQSNLDNIKKRLISQCSLVLD